jgi:hypothetical protein
MEHTSTMSYRGKKKTKHRAGSGDYAEPGNVDGRNEKGALVHVESQHAAATNPHRR